MRFLTVISAIPVAVTLVQRGVLTPQQAGWLLVAIIVTIIVVYNASRIILPIFAISIFLTSNVSTSSDLIQLLPPLLALALCLAGIYIMLRALFAGGRRNKDRQ